MTIAIWGKYQGKVERIDTASSQRDASYLVNEYQLAYGRDWTVWAGLKRDEPCLNCGFNHGARR